jgi:hypothetical protein
MAEDQQDEDQQDDAVQVDDRESPTNREVSEEEQQEIEEERERRLASENRPENAEVDNTSREFDSSIGQFTDHEPDPDLGPFVIEGEEEEKAEEKDDA